MDAAVPARPAADTRIGVVMPVFDDWEAFEQLLALLDAVDLPDGVRMIVVAVDDGSSRTAPASLGVAGAILGLRVIRLACNLGHQRAIAIGLVAALEDPDLQAIVVMDSDGEDLPGDVARLVSHWRADPGRIVVAKRGQRHESRLFKTFYIFYKALFHLLVGQSIDFGNFCILPRQAAVSLTHSSMIWNNLAAAISRSRLSYRRLTLDRGPRLAGRSHMNFVNLVLHGVSALSVFAEVVLVRMVVLSFALCGAISLTGGVVLGIRLGTDLAIPGWTSTVLISLVIVFLQALVLGVLSVFQLLNARVFKTFVPAVDAHIYVVGDARVGERSDRMAGVAP